LPLEELEPEAEEDDEEEPESTDEADDEDTAGFCSVLSDEVDEDSASLGAAAVTGAGSGSRPGSEAPPRSCRS